MQNDLTITTVETVENGPLDVRLGTCIGRQQAFGVVAGKSTTAQIDSIREIRETRAYRRLTPSWGEFCTKILGSNKRAVDRMIRQLETYGPDFFTLTQFTRIPPSAYEAIAPHLADEALTLDGQSFALTAENAQQLASAVSELRKRAAAENPKTETPPDEIIEKQVRSLIVRLTEIGPTLEPDRQAAVSQLISHLLDYATAPSIAA